MHTNSAVISGGGIRSLATALGLGTTIKARAIQFIADSANSGIPTVGGANLASGNGFPVLKTAPLYLPYTAIWTDVYDFTQVFVDVASGDKLYALWENG